MQGYSYNTHSYMEQAREEGFHTKEKRSPIERGGGQQVHYRYLRCLSGVEQRNKSKPILWPAISIKLGDWD
jgi:hypothetical protein